MSNAEHPRAVARASSLDLADEERRRLADKFIERTYTPGETITLRGRKTEKGTNPSHSLYVPTEQAPAVVKLLRRHIR